MRGIKQNIRSTREKKQPLTYQLYNGETLTIPLKKNQDIYIAINDAKEIMYTDQTVAFPVTSKKGNKYIMILYEIDNNVIMSEATRNRSSGEIFRTYLILMKKIKSAGIRPNKNVLNNEFSTEFKLAIKENEL